MTTCTRTRTWPLLDAWASTLPHTVPERHPAAGQPCAVDECAEPLAAGEECYAVTQLPRGTDGEQWVCWRHVRPDQGPVRVLAGGHHHSNT